ncbi:Tat pathway signal sequence domain protein [Opitutus sp. ER46]|uniref:exo-rhamnogalacturonan lyase family protein n=1 Tax=Opitutus sp. ER46 TaxID=2161864 RepID=UPI000D3184CC|nr:Tat pathway signal sequence domain protein [Opitutus sp. ER46]PTX92575.1 Tat pathway signal sequence domain protein [Opitutus sp. ER46]
MKASLLALLALPLFASAAPVSVHWLDGAPPPAPDGVTWGVPWAKGELKATDPLALVGADGTAIPVQSWPLAFWPDGSVKWSGHAIAAQASLPASFQLAVGQPAAPTQALTVTDTADAITVDTGGFVARIGKRGPNVIESFTTAAGAVAREGHLVAQTQTGGAATEFVSDITSATVERSGPVHAVIKVTGRHLATTGNRAVLPFTVRLSFFAGSPAVRVTHSFVYDLDPQQDALRGIGLTFAVPFREQLQNRHVRLAGETDAGMWAQPVRMLPGFRTQAGPEVVQLYPQHLAGQRVPNVADLEPRTRDALQTMPIWADAKLTQLSPNGWSIAKRTTSAASWLHVNDGRRSRGLALVGDCSGALAVGVKDFWQKAPRSIEITGGASPAADLRVWFWSPEAPAMDLRRYDEIPHGLAINYEDWKPGWGTPLGIANTQDLTLWVLNGVPRNETLVGMSRVAAEPSLLVCPPEHYHAQHAFGYWSLPDRSTPTLRWIEDQVQGFVDFYHGQVEERSWYGFWDFGDIMHNYDFERHEWRYDVGGWAWANTELMPDMLLWYSFLRTGRADLYRFAAAMTRHTSEVDAYHIGPFAPLGSRHNVNHWGDGAKQPRASHAGLKRAFYFLSGGDGRVGDLLREQLDADLTYEYLQQFNASHYVPDADGRPVLDARKNPRFPNAPSAVPAPRPEEFTARRTAAQREPFTRFGLEWMCYAANWTTEWERGGDPRWRAEIESAMRAMARNVDADGKFQGRYFDMIFGGPENMWEMEPMYDIPEFWRAWVATSEAVGRAVQGNEMTGPRMLAYAANRKGDAALGRMAWEKLIGPAGVLPPLPQPKRYAAPSVVRPVTDPAFLGASVGWQLHGVASVQWALNAIETLELARAYLPEWEKPSGE